MADAIGMPDGNTAHPADGPGDTHQRGALDPGRVHDRQQVAGEVIARVARRRPAGPAAAAPVPRDDAEATLDEPRHLVLPDAPMDVRAGRRAHDSALNVIAPEHLVMDANTVDRAGRQATPDWLK